MFFRDLDKDEEIKFRQWARENFQPGDPIKTFWHPVIQDECQKINNETTI